MKLEFFLILLQKNRGKGEEETPPPPPDQYRGEILNVFYALLILLCIYEKKILSGRFII